MKSPLPGTISVTALLFMFTLFFDYTKLLMMYLKNHTFLDCFFILAHIFLSLIYFTPWLSGPLFPAVNGIPLRPPFLGQSLLL